METRMDDCEPLQFAQSLDAHPPFAVYWPETECNPSPRGSTMSTSRFHFPPAMATIAIALLLGTPVARADGFSPAGTKAAGGDEGRAAAATVSAPAATVSALAADASPDTRLRTLGRVLGHYPE